MHKGYMNNVYAFSSKRARFRRYGRLGCIRRYNKWRRSVSTRILPIRILSNRVSSFPGGDSIAERQKMVNWRFVENCRFREHADFHPPLFSVTLSRRKSYLSDLRKTKCEGYAIFEETIRVQCHTRGAGGFGDNSFLFLGIRGKC